MSFKMEPRKEKCIIIEFIDGDMKCYREGQYGEYDYDGCDFVVRDPKGGLLGLFNTDEVKSVCVENLSPEQIDEIEQERDWRDQMFNTDVLCHDPDGHVISVPLSELLTSQERLSVSDAEEIGQKISQSQKASQPQKAPQSSKTVPFNGGNHNNKNNKNWNKNGRK